MYVSNSTVQIQSDQLHLWTTTTTTNTNTRSTLQCVNHSITYSNVRLCIFIVVDLSDPIIYTPFVDMNFNQIYFIGIKHMVHTSSSSHTSVYIYIKWKWESYPRSNWRQCVFTGAIAITLYGPDIDSKQKEWFSAEQEMSVSNILWTAMPTVFDWGPGKRRTNDHYKIRVKRNEFSEWILFLFPT